MQYRGLAVFLLCGMLAMAGCGGGSGGGNNDNASNTGTTEVTTDPGTTNVTATITGPASSKAGSLSKAAIPSQAASVTLEVKTPDCSGTAAYTTKMDTAGQTSVAFNFTLTAGSTACFTAGAYSGTGGAGTLLYQGSTSGINLVAGESVNVEVSLSEIGAVDPTVTTDAATSLGATSATLNATINPNGFETTAYFEWGIDTTYGNITPIQTIGSGTANVAISQAITGLTAGTTYHYRAVANNSGNTVYGSDQSLTTINTTDSGVTVTFPSTSAPTATTNAATSVTGTGATLNATVNPQGSATTAYFEWGTTTSYGNTTPWQDAGNGTADTPVSAALTGLTTGTTYHYRVVAYNAHGLTTGADRMVTASTVSLSETGQTTSYAAGDDGDLEKGVAWPDPRFTVGTGAEADCVTDNLTGLMWVKNPDSTTRTWADALTYADGLSLCGYTDWRLPNVNELESMWNAGQSDSATWLNSQGFSNVQTNFYWSSTMYVNNTGAAWSLSLVNGIVYGDYRTAFNYVWLVRSTSADLPKTGQTTSYAAGDDGDLEKGVAWPDPRFTVGTGAEADCVTDNLTGLIWVKSPDSTTRTWADALIYANDLNLCGYTDWRLPSRKELISLANYSQTDNDLWLNSQGFSNINMQIMYWSSTTDAEDTGAAWVVYLNRGYVGSTAKDAGTFVWPVRGGQ